jgi:hypothetical protein
MSSKLSRREYLRQSWSLAVTMLAGTLGAAACSKQPAATAACTDTSQLSAADQQNRVTLAYVDRSTVSGRNCANCSLYIEARESDQCGGCQIVKGPISAAGYCAVWAAKTV